MDRAGQSSGYRPLALQDFDERPESDVELTVLPESRAPSHGSSKVPAFSEPGDDVGLIQRARSSSYANVLLGKFATIKDKRKKLQGWRFGVVWSAWMATAVLVLNTLMTVIAVATVGSTAGIGTAFEGSCNRTKSITTSLHVIINILSSMLLGASNYTMQALVAPTRAETDRAHAEGRWLDIGVASIRNLFKIKRHRTILWIVLGLSSMPIHLLYNSAVFETIGANPYIATVASPAWINGGDFSTVVQITIPSSLEHRIPFHESDMRKRAISIRDMFQANLHNTSRVQNLSTQECISTYSPNFVSRNNHVVAITNQVVHTSRTSYFDLQDDGTDEKVWMCADLPDSTYKCDPRQINPANWTIYDRKIEYCLSEALPQHCKVQFSVYILVVVIFMNAVKSIAMFVAVRGHKDVTLVTIGDAIASYLEAPGEFAQAGCLMGRKDVKHLKKEGQATRARHLYSEPKAYAPVYHARWSKAASQARWLSCLFLVVAALTATGLLLFQAGSAFGLGWGTFDLNALLPLNLSGGQGIIYGVLVANTPQLLVSFLYVLFNSLLTTLLLAKEWSDFALHRKALRVTTRRGAQRSTYWLQLPYRYSLPLLAILATLHWLISQSLFLARVAYYLDGVPFGENADVSSVGYSAGPILTAMTIIIVSTAILVALGFRKLDSTMPIAGSCSLAIAAACHRPKDDVDAALKPVQWGEVAVEGGDGEIGHCCFTSQPVTSPIPGRLYA